MREEITAATERLLTTVDGLDDAGWSAPSLCTGWSRAHVVAHLALNAEGLAGALRGLAAGRPVPMYRSQVDRDADIEALAAERPAAVRERLASGSAALSGALDDLASLPGGARFERTPGGPLVEAEQVPLMRLREVEIHHADLDAGYTHRDWPLPTAVTFLEGEIARYDGPPVVVRATDSEGTWESGDAATDPTVVSGPAAALAWWLSGRDPGDDLTSTADLPGVEGR